MAESVTGVRRHMMPVRRLSLTDLSCKLARGAREKSLKAALGKEEVMKRWSETAWAKKVAAKEARATMTDFDRFKVMVARKKRSKEVRGVMKKKRRSEAWARLGRGRTLPLTSGSMR